MPMPEEPNRRPSDGGLCGGAPREPILREAVRRIVEQVHPLRIILFGSVARDEQSVESDVDLLVVMPEGTHKRHTAQMLYRGLRGLPVAVDVLVTTEVDLHRHKDNPGLAYGTILEEGRELYAA
jgi:predicted nucleotidyltransferase